MEHNLLTLDFWQDSVTYEGTTVPTGTLGCEVLNISDSTIEKLTNLCAPLNSFMGTLRTPKPDLALLPPAKDSAIEIINLLSDVPPFSRLDHTFYSKWIEETFVPEAVQECLMSSMALMSGGLTSEQQEQYKRGLRLARLLPVFANLGYSLAEYKKTMTDFAVKMDAPNSDRSPDGLAELFGQQFPPELSFTNDGAWMSVTNTSMQYISVLRPGYDVPMLVKRMHFVTFVGMLRTDLFEGLCVGHAPKKCPICGRWFLTTNARHTKYCGNPAPGDKFGRTCRQLGNLKGREQRELADDHPIKLIYERRLNTINRYIKRGTLDANLAKAMKKLAKDKMLRALSDSRYAKGSYEKEMEQENLIVEVKEKQ